MNTSLQLNFNNTTLKVSVTTVLYREHEAWLIKLPSGEETIVVKDHDVWKQVSDKMQDENLVMQIGMALDRALESGKEAFVVQDRDAPPTELF